MILPKTYNQAEDMKVFGLYSLEGKNLFSISKELFTQKENSTVELFLYVLI